MLINVNIETLLQSKITAHQYLIVLFISQGKYNELQTYLEQTFSEEHVRADLDWLWKQGYLMELMSSPTMTPTNYQITGKFKQLISGGDFFEELYNEYPIKVIRVDGNVDYLRADKDTARRIYAALTRGDKQVHDHIMKCLRFDLKRRYANNTLNYMKRLNKWLSSREWESYEDEVEDSLSATTNEEDTRYGTELG